MLIHLIRHHKGIVFQGQSADGQQLVPGKHLAAGVGGVAQNKGLRPIPEALLHLVQVKVIVRRHQRNVDGLCPGENGIRPVIFIEGREHHHPVARVADGHHGAHHGFGAAAGHHDLLVRVNGPADGLPLLFRHRLPEVLRAKGDGILVRPLFGGTGQRVCNFLGRVKIREPLRQVDRPISVADPGHPADHGIRKGRHPVAQFWHFLFLPCLPFRAQSALVPSSYSPFDPKSTFRGLPRGPAGLSQNRSSMLSR